MATIDYKTSGIVTDPTVLISVAKLMRTNIRDTARLCTSSMINKWSRYKPFKSDALFYKQDTDDSYIDRDNDLSSENYGLSLDTSKSHCNKYNGTYGTSTQVMVDDAIAGTLPEWVYVKPDDNYRLLDFLGYYHNALAPIRIVENMRYRLNNDNSISLGFYVNFNGDGSSAKDKASLTLSDLHILGDSNNLGDYYFGILVYADSSHWDLATMDETIDEVKDKSWDMLGLSITLTNVKDALSPSTFKTCYAIPFVSTIRSSDSTFDTSRSVIAFGFAKAPLELRTYSDATDKPLYADTTTLIVGTSSQDSSKKSFYLYLYIRNNSGGNVTLPFVKITAYCDSFATQKNYVIYNDENVVIPANSSYGDSTGFIEIEQDSGIYDYFMENCNRYSITWNTYSDNDELGHGKIYHLDGIPEL